VNLTGADITGANLSGLTGLAFITGAPCYDASMNLTNAWLDEDATSFVPVSAGWTLVPELFAAILVGPGLVVSVVRRRR